MVEKTFQQELFIQTMAERVDAFYENMQNHQLVHHLIVIIKKLGKAHDGQAYQITDRLKMCWLNFTIRYKITVQKIGRGHCRLQATQALGIRV